MLTERRSTWRLSQGRRREWDRFNAGMRLLFCSGVRHGTAPPIEAAQRPYLVSKDIQILRGRSACTCRARQFDVWAQWRERTRSHPLLEAALRMPDRLDVFMQAHELAVHKTPSTAGAESVPHPERR